MAELLVRLKVQTVYGSTVYPGQEVMVPDYVARRWSRYGIADTVETPAPAEEAPLPAVTEATPLAALLEAAPLPEPETDEVGGKAIETPVEGTEGITAPAIAPEDASHFADSTAPSLQVKKPKRQSKAVTKTTRE